MPNCAMDYDAIRYNGADCDIVIQYNIGIISYDAMRYDALQYNLLLKHAVHYSTMQCDTMRLSICSCNIIQYYTI